MSFQLEHSLFEFNHCVYVNEIGETLYNYENVVLKIPIGKFPKGERFIRALINFNEATLSLIKLDDGYEQLCEIEYKFQLAFTVLNQGPEILTQYL